MGESSAALRRKLVAKLEKARTIKTPAVRRAFLAVPREIFLDDHLRRGGLEAVYRDVALTTKTDAKGGAISSSSQPAIMAVMLEALRIRRGQRILEIGAGTGYNAALLSRLTGPRGRITTIDIDPELVARSKAALRKSGSRVSAVAGDGREGYAAHAPYDRIIVAASTDNVPRAWWIQLRSDGLLEVPFRLLQGATSIQSVIVFERTDTGFRSIDSNPGGFMGLRGSTDEQAPLVRSDRALGAYEATGTTATMYGFLSGRALARGSRDEKRRLLQILLQEPRTRVVATRSQGNALQVFLTLGLPKPLVVQYAARRRFGVGVVSPDLDGVAVTVRPPNGPTELHCFGAPSAERLLRTRLSEWEALGSPGDRDLAISVSFDAAPTSWRVLKRRDSYVGVNWRQKPRGRASRTRKRVTRG